MDHHALTDAVRARETLSVSSAERHGTYRVRTARPCPNRRCVDGEVFRRDDPADPQSENSEPCRTCDGHGTFPVPRQIPGTRRAA